MRGFARVSMAVPVCTVADPLRNAEQILALWTQAHDEQSALVAFPELGLCGYSIRDLLLDRHLQQACDHALAFLAQSSFDLSPLALVGMPLRVGSGLYNVAVALQGGRVLAVIPKSFLPNYGEFEEARWFRPGTEVPPQTTIELLGQRVPFGCDILLRAHTNQDLVVGVELCEDFWVPLPPSAFQVSAGATVVCNLSASNFVVGKAEVRRLLGRSMSDRGKCAYAYVAAGPGESSTDMTFDADAFICENGRVLVSSERFSRDSQLITSDIDLDLLVRERLVTTSFGDCSQRHRQTYRSVSFASPTEVSPPLRRDVSPHPFLPDDPVMLQRRCWEIFEIQTNALVTRHHAVGAPNFVLGLSGGLDSTHAALVCCAALDQLKLPRRNLVCVTLPGLGTSDSTRDNARQLAQDLGATLREIDISAATHLVLEQLEHPATLDATDHHQLLARLRDDEDLADVAVENAQARLRTLLLMTLANQCGGIVVGTGDLSERALGWSTYAGDQISMYDVNAGVPKTLIQFVIRWVANERAGAWSAGRPHALRTTLFRILDTPISPELLPPNALGEIAQLTEAQIGPYELHDFFLYHLVRHGARPTRILDLASVAFAGRYALADLKRWLSVFIQRFFRYQFKRSCTADGPKVGMVALSPRADWRMPSDASAQSWLREVEAYVTDPA